MRKQIKNTSSWIDDEGNVYGVKGLRKPKLTKTGYLEIIVYNNVDGTREYYRVHRLVALYFIPNPENKPFVNHKDGNKLNNRVENLEWVTHEENMNHAKIHGLVKRAEENTNSILTSDQVEQVCKLMEMGYRNYDIRNSLNLFDTSLEAISCIRNKTTWTHISCKYNIPSKSRSLSCETIRWICEKIRDGHTQGEILSMTDNHKITKSIIKDIRRKRIYKDISSLYF